MHPLDRYPKIEKFVEGQILFYSEYDGVNDWKNYANSIEEVVVGGETPQLKTLYFTQDNGRSFKPMARISDLFSVGKDSINDFREVSEFFNSSLKLVSDVNNEFSIKN